MEPRPDTANRRNPPARKGTDRQTGSWQGNGLFVGVATRRDPVVRRDPDRAHRAQCLQPRVWVALAGAGVGADAGAACLVSRDGRSGADGADQGCRGVGEALKAVGGDSPWIVLDEDELWK